MFSKLAYSTLLTVSLGTVMSCQAEVTGTNFTAAFDHPQQINAGDLNVGYVDIGPKNGQPVILLHGWPYDIHSLCRSCARAGGKRLPGYCAFSAATAPRASCQQNAAQRPAFGDGERYC
jgi:hypothetical protein